MDLEHLKVFPMVITTALPVLLEVGELKGSVMETLMEVRSLTNKQLNK